MAFSKALYFTALLPPKDVKEEIKQMKLDLRKKWGVAHALKLPAHITLLPPFWLEIEKEDILFQNLTAATSKTDPFSVEINGFGKFGQRVIFIKVKDHEPTKEIHRKLVDATHELIPPLEESELHPHITIATRDLTREKFVEVWPEFQDKDFKRSFPVNAVFLFRHNGKSWEVIKEFRFLGR